MSDRWLKGSNSESGILRKAKPQHTADPHLDDLLVFGYACKIFRDNERASEIDHGKQLIPWMGDQSLKIDRYDVRATLSDIRPYEAPPGGYVDRMALLTPAEQRAEQLCEEERYYSLYNNDVEEEMYQDETLKRLHKERSSTYGQVAFDYDARPSENTESQVESTVSEEPDVPFTANPKFYVPPDIELPDTVKLHAVIEKTAKFIAAQGPQMEILIKAKQCNNPQFEFLNLNNRLNAYYKHVLNAVKHGFYPADEEEATETTEEQPTNTTTSIQETEEGTPTNENYPAIVVPQLKYKPSADCSYTQLISKIKRVPIPMVAATEASHSAETQFANDATLQHIMEYRNKLKINSDTTQQQQQQKPPPSTMSDAFPGRKLSAPLLETPKVLNNLNVSNASPEASKTTSLTDVNKITTTTTTAEVEVKKISSALMLAQCYNSETDEDDDEEEEERQNQNGAVNKEDHQPNVVYDFPVPPADLKNIIDKTAAYVLKNGKEFEEILRTKNDARFSFLKYTDQYYRYYVHKVTGAICSAPLTTTAQQQQQPDANVAQIPKVTEPKIADPVVNAPKVITSVSFSIKPKDDGPSLKPRPLRETSSDEEPDCKTRTTKPPAKATVPAKMAVTPKAPASEILHSSIVPIKESIASVALLPTPVPPVSIPLLPTPITPAQATNGTNIVPIKDEAISAIEHNSDNNKLDVSDSNIRDAIIENTVVVTNISDEIREAKRAEDRLKDRLAQVARDKLGQVTKDKQLQLERRKKAMAFLNQIKPVDKVVSALPEIVQPISINDRLVDAKTVVVNTETVIENNHKSPVHGKVVDKPKCAAEISPEYKTIIGSKSESEIAELSNDRRQVVNDSDDSILSIHSVHSSPERPPIIIENGGVVSDDDDDPTSDDKEKRKKRKHKRSRSRSKSSSSKRHKRSKKSKHSKKSKSSRRDSRSRSCSPDTERRRNRRHSRSRSKSRRSDSTRRSRARSTRDSSYHKSSSSSSKQHRHHRYRDRD